jgi:LEA14-like dessication related protein
MKRIVLAALLMAGWSVFSTGCATVPRSGAFGLSLVSIRPLQASLFETSAELTLRYTNESARPIELRGATHRLYLNGSYVGRAVTNQPLTIPPLGTMTHTVTAQLENLALMRKAQELGNVPTMDYRIDSRLHAAGEFDGAIFAASATGHLDLSGFLPAGRTATRGE